MGARAVLIALLLLLATAEAAAAAPSTSLRITVWPQGREHAARSWTLRCGPVGGTLPNKARACRTLARLRAPFAPVPADRACTQIYGGPAVAYVRGTFRGRRIHTWFNRRDGCQTARWDRVRVIFPVGGSGG